MCRTNSSNSLHLYVVLLPLIVNSDMFLFIKKDTLHGLVGRILVLVPCLGHEVVVHLQKEHLKFRWQGAEHWMGRGLRESE